MMLVDERNAGRIQGGEPKKMRGPTYPWFVNHWSSVKNLAEMVKRTWNLQCRGAECEDKESILEFVSGLVGRANNVLGLATNAAASLVDP